MKDEVAWYEHEITHYEDQRGSDHKTTESYNTVIKDGDSYKMGKTLTAEEFTRLANRKDTEIKTTTQKQKLTGATRATQDTHVETAYITTVKVYPAETG